MQKHYFWHFCDRKFGEMKGEKRIIFCLDSPISKMPKKDNFAIQYHNIKFKQEIKNI